MIIGFGVAKGSNYKGRGERGKMEDILRYGPAVEEVCRQVKENGFGILRGVIDGECVDKFVKEIEDYMRSATAPLTGAKRDSDGGTVLRAHDASFGRGVEVTLGDKSTWPNGGTRRVFECVPMGSGSHWEALEQSKPLRACLDSLLGDDCWEMPLNRSPPQEGGVFVRHWYSPVVFPEFVHGVHQPPIIPPQRPEGGGEAQTSPGEQRGFRNALLESWKGEIALNGPLVEGCAAGRWQPVNRRRFCSKGWHIDIGPGFEMSDIRTLQGDPRQGVVLLVLLSDWMPGCGGTCFIQGSHEWVRRKLQEGDGGGMTHDSLNIWCQDRMRELTEEGKVLLATTGEDHGPPPDGCVVGEQVVGKKGDIVAMHPWTIHSGTTNMGAEARLMMNGMIKVKEEAFGQVGCKILGSSSSSSK